MTIQPPSAPVSNSGNAKAYAAVVAGALATLVVYAVDQLTHSTTPPEIVAAVQTVITAGLVWLVPHNIGG